MSNFNIEKIHKTIWVFKNALKDTDAFIEYINKDKEWVDWYTFGTKAQLTGFRYNFNSFPTTEEWKNKIPSDKDSNVNFGYFEDKINNLFYETTKMYVEENSISFNNWSFHGWDVAKYRPILDHDWAMMYHTDYQRNIAYAPGEKFGITAVFYLNDDYDGGEVVYRFLNNDDINIVEEDYSYKPSKGDVVVFMSGHPHYHGVKSVKNGEKYMIRTYWKYDYPGHHLWLKLEEKYGKEQWLKMEYDRKKFNEDPNNITNINDIPFWVSFEEYYKEQIKNLGL